ncbi:4-hydroxythreonine-4-phosphate dehydrogenase [Shouchella clausii]|uniref:4-hydroxythreonine-4-phosphate dehydrogenase PdxA n=1 Tax=Shouchella clausii TaxID=79880 RepID=A0A268NVL7_SHOCL|nr:MULTISPECIES: 4-hydroxythreonine-4-phosphate dehydrogenase PdxA [Shouchella]MCM3314256.1 4-hydroxythreonine-4-phosphate dehydrogenase PdxA [Psychrobacillus sp. MER TA 17]MCM3380758.1 4-hydroxythreonine-4-phosphate dehydrogenase PdxA [Shouchella rhizosphaerae]PAE79892.1 4-hydroxythreonine-4-phosphate dehydrogenase PdxA [Shouchella clausii]PAE87299.1 4-hydroxythreonine-4-phosphate dehydrogenase PdxA [Shouchella clausii]GIN08545.1 4-hydroxythreonine-4-phosphate dehydrogenase [Shouchella clausi
MRPIIGITMGDAAGVGPEIIAKALADESTFKIGRPVVIGDAAIMERAVDITETELNVVSVSTVDECVFEPGTIEVIDLRLLTEGVSFGQVSEAAGNAAFRYVERAVELAKAKKINAICTAPLNKEAMQKAGHLYPGHTEILAELTGTTDFSMMLSAPNLKVIHLTTHVGLRKAIDTINPERTYKVISLAHETLAAAGNKQPKIAVCGINPHAGENGLFGEGEEEEKLVPAIEKARGEGIDVEGPYPADTLFFRAARGDFDIVVACYHDQGHVPIKVMGLEAGVNITVGLKGGIVRTSVDHGTAFDIAGKNIADERSLLAAYRDAVELAPK